MEMFQSNQTFTGRNYAGSYSDYNDCCPPVFNPYTMIALIGGIALATYFLRIVIITENFAKRSFGNEGFLNSILSGNLSGKRNY